MDGVLANFDQGHIDACVRAGIPRTHHGEDRNTWDVLQLVPREDRDRLVKLWHAPGFFRALYPMDGAVDGARALRRQGHEVFICTAPLLNHATCAAEKIEWVRAHLGDEFAARVIITRDKTLIHGDYLVDDRPDIHGVHTPTWKHLLFEASYNRHAETTNWRKLRSTFATSRPADSSSSTSSGT